MPNYSMKYGVSEVAQILKVDRELIKIWSYTFSEYLGKEANPAKGVPRRFTLEDIRILAYVSLDWEDSSDIEAIKIGLNSGGHFEDVFDELIQETTQSSKRFQKILRVNLMIILFLVAYHNLVIHSIWLIHINWPETCWLKCLLQR
jgi:hypothetical protein